MTSPATIFSRYFQRSRAYLYLWVGFFFLLSCHTEPEIHRDFQILYSVNGVERTVYDFESRYVEYLISTGKNDTYYDRYTFLNQLIDEILLAQSAENKGYHLTEKHRAAVQYELQKSVIDHYFVDQMEQEIPELTDEEIRLAYAKRQRKVYVRQLYSKDPNELEIALEALREGEPFVDVANEFYELNPYDSLVGYLGPISYFGVDDVVAEAAYSTNQGDFTSIIRSRLGFHILYVEYVEFPALLAEDEYQYRKSGVESQLRLRKQRMISNDYVYNLMSSLSVETENDAILELKEVIEQLDNQALIEQSMIPESGETIWTDERIQSLSSSYNHETTLASYVLSGERESFTFGDYLKWLPYLSFQESKLRLGASIGRAMRNEVLYRLASTRNYQEDERVKRNVSHRSIQYLSEYNQYKMQQAALSDTSYLEVPNSFVDRMIKAKEQVMEAEYWIIPTSSIQEARSIKNQVTSEGSPNRFDGFKQYEMGLISGNNDHYDLVKKSVLAQPTIGYSSQEGWMVLMVLDRELRMVSEESKVDDLQLSYRLYSAIEQEIDRLRSNADIRIDTTLFDSIYNLWDSSNSSE